MLGVACRALLRHMTLFFFLCDKKFKGATLVFKFVLGDHVCRNSHAPYFFQELPPTVCVAKPVGCVVSAMVRSDFDFVSQSTTGWTGAVDVIISLVETISQSLLRLQEDSSEGSRS